MGGFLMIMGILSFPLPWTPVPFSLMPIGLIVAGAAQKPGYAMGSVAIYLLAAGLGAPVFADGESGWSWFVGSTAGYLVGYFVMAFVISWFMQRSRDPMPPGTALGILVFMSASVIAGVVAIIAMTVSGEGLNARTTELDSTWAVGRSTLWVMLFLFSTATVTVLWMLKRSRGEQATAWTLLVVMFASILILHAFGVTVLWIVSPLSLIDAIILGSIVFLPFDMVKAGLGVGLVLPFVPTENSHE
jgi:biotin transporter BioY